MLDINKLKELNQALEENLISQEEYEKLKKNLLNQSTQTIPNYDLSQILGVSGSIILFLGIFAPIVAAPIVGNINLSNTQNGFIFVILAIASLICSITKKYNLLLITGISSLALIALITINIFKPTEAVELEAVEFLDTSGLDNLLFQPQYGIAVIIIGSILMISAAYRHHHQKTNEKAIYYIRNAVGCILLLFFIVMLSTNGIPIFSLSGLILIAFVSVFNKKVMKLNKHLNEKAKKRRFKKYK